VLTKQGVYKTLKIIIITPTPTQRFSHQLVYNSLTFVSLPRIQAHFLDVLIYSLITLVGGAGLAAATWRHTQPALSAVLLAPLDERFVPEPPPPPRLMGCVWVPPYPFAPQASPSQTNPPLIQAY
jgi:hypothetical protein